MGSQARLARSVSMSYVISENVAWELVDKFEAIEIGDELSDALYLVESGKPEEGFQQLFELVGELAAAIVTLKRSMRPLEVRK
jgi:hypothetical protein